MEKGRGEENEKGKRGEDAYNIYLEQQYQLPVQWSISVQKM